MRFGRSYSRTSLFTLFILFAGLILADVAVCSGETAPPLRVDSVVVNSISAHAAQDDPHILLVTVRLTVRASDQLIVIPNCVAANADTKVFCVAGLRRANGKGIGVRKGLAATLGSENFEYWKPIVLQPHTEESFNFTIDTELLDVHCGEQLRVWFQVWPNSESMKDWKLATTLMSPVFKCPSQPN